MSVYVISNDLNAEANLFKLGRTIASPESLLSTYRRSLWNPELLLWYPTQDHVSAETQLLRKLAKYRKVDPKTGKKNEWLNLSFIELKAVLDAYFEMDGEWDCKARRLLLPLLLLFVGDPIRSKHHLDI